MRIVLALLAVPMVAACGRAASVEPAPGRNLPVAAYGDRRQPGVGELLTPSVQARPTRGDELLGESQDRRNDDFALPPRA